MIETPRSISPIAHIGAIPLVLCSTCKWLFWTIYWQHDREATSIYVVLNIFERRQWTAWTAWCCGTLGKELKPIVMDRRQFKKSVRWRVVIRKSPTWSTLRGCKRLQAWAARARLYAARSEKGDVTIVIASAVPAW
jgi:hypothetical protein